VRTLTPKNHSLRMIDGALMGGTWARSRDWVEA
jgi:hypothetical protein